MPIDFARLLPLGWSNFFSIQIPLEEFDRVRPARVDTEGWWLTRQRSVP